MMRKLDITVLHQNLMSLGARSLACAARKKYKHTEYDTATRNLFIGAMCATGELTKSANLIDMEKSAASHLWKKA